MQRILLISHQLDLSGAAIALFDLAIALKTLKSEVCVLPLVPNGPLRQQYQSAGIPVEGTFAGKFDLCIANTVLGARVLPQLKGKIPKLVAWIHESPTFSSYHPSLDYSQIPKDAVDLVLGVAAFQVEALRQALPGVPVARFDNTFHKPEVTKTANQISLPKKTGNGSDSDAIDVCIIGYPEKRKGLYKLRDLSETPNGLSSKKIRFNLLGCDTKSAEQLLQGCTLPSNYIIRPHGRLPHEEVMMHLAESDLLLCLSEDEVKPLTILEAINAGVSVIASDIPAHREMAEEFPSICIAKDPIKKLIGLRRNELIQSNTKSSFCRYSWKSFIYRAELLINITIASKTTN